MMQERKVFQTWSSSSIESVDKIDEKKKKGGIKSGAKSASCAVSRPFS